MVGANPRLQVHITEKRAGPFVTPPHRAPQLNPGPRESRYETLRYRLLQQPARSQDRVAGHIVPAVGAICSFRSKAVALGRAKIGFFTTRRVRCPKWVKTGNAGRRLPCPV